MSEFQLGLLILGWCAAWGLIPVLLHRTRPRTTVERHYAADGTTTTTSKDIA